METTGESYPLKIWSGLFQPKHMKAMGQAIWLFGVLIDMVTAEENGVGYVWGGKPVRYSDIKAKLDIPRSKYSRWLKTLADHKYIITRKTRTGLIIKIVKSKKFTKKNASCPKNRTARRSVVSKIGQQGVRLSQKQDIRCPKNETSDVLKIGQPYIDIKEDIKEDNIEPSYYMKIWKMVHPVFNLPESAYSGYVGDIITTINRLGYENTVKCVTVLIKKKQDHSRLSMDKLFRWKKLDEYMMEIPKPKVILYFVCMNCGDAKQVPKGRFEDSPVIRDKITQCDCGGCRSDMTYQIKSWADSGKSWEEIRGEVNKLVAKNNDPDYIRKQIEGSLAN